MVFKLVVIVVAMFGFGYALVPIYKAICEATGINVLAFGDKASNAEAARLRNSQVDKTRTVSVEFDANVHGPWRMVPTVKSMQVHPGELTTVTYEIANQQARTITGQAIPSYAPGASMPYFHKIECFCFQQQTLGPNQVRQFPVVFVIDPEVPRDMHTITLSYTFFEIAGATGQAPAPVKGGSNG